MTGKAISEFCTDFFEYDTPMMVHIKNKTVGIVNRVFEFVILSYIVFYGIIYEKGYQEYDDVRSAVATKLKGILYESNTSFGRITWDVADYVVPPLESNAFFVITSVVVTRMQVQKTCSENPKIQAAWCDKDEDCQSKIGMITPTGNGPFTGKCVQSAILPTRKVCEIYGWCPVEDDRKKLSTFNASERFTVLIKNNIEFPKFNFRKRNIMDWYATDSEMGKCRWNPDDPRDKYCPIFELGVIAKGAGVEYSSLLATGGIIKIIIDWNCDLDFSEDYCRPEYSFRWLDSGNFTVSVGFNFRYADHFFMRDDNNTVKFYRNLYKAFGVHFLVEVRGRAGKFHFVNLMFNVGSGMALLGIASILSDIVVLYFLKARKLYKDRKFQIAETCPYETLAEDTCGTSEAWENTGNHTADGKHEEKEDKVEP